MTLVYLLVLLFFSINRIDKSLFQRLMQSICHMQNVVKDRTHIGKPLLVVLIIDTQIPLFIMTSEFNNQAIEDHIHFLSNSFFLNDTL